LEEKEAVQSPGQETEKTLKPSLACKPTGKKKGGKISRRRKKGSGSQPERVRPKKEDFLFVPKLRAAPEKKEERARNKKKKKRGESAKGTTRVLRR